MLYCPCTAGCLEQLLDGQELLAWALAILLTWSSCATPRDGDECDALPLKCLEGMGELFVEGQGERCAQVCQLTWLHDQPSSAGQEGKLALPSWETGLHSVY